MFEMSLKIRQFVGVAVYFFIYFLFVDLGCGFAILVTWVVLF